MSIWLPKDIYEFCDALYMVRLPECDIAEVLIRELRCLSMPQSILAIDRTIRSFERTFRETFDEFYSGVLRHLRRPKSLMRHVIAACLKLATGPTFFDLMLVCAFVRHIQSRNLTLRRCYKFSGVMNVCLVAVFFRRFRDMAEDELCFPLMYSYCESVNDVVYRYGSADPTEVVLSQEDYRGQDSVFASYVQELVGESERTQDHIAGLSVEIDFFEEDLLSAITAPLRGERGSPSTSDSDSSNEDNIKVDADFATDPDDNPDKHGAVAEPEIILEVEADKELLPLKHTGELQTPLEEAIEVDAGKKLLHNQQTDQGELRTPPNESLAVDAEKELLQREQTSQGTSQAPHEVASDKLEIVPPDNEGLQPEISLAKSVKPDSEDTSEKQSMETVPNKKETEASLTENDSVERKLEVSTGLVTQVSGTLETNNNSQASESSPKSCTQSDTGSGKKIPNVKDPTETTEIATANDISKDCGEVTEHDEDYPLLPRKRKSDQFEDQRKSSGDEVEATLNVSIKSSAQPVSDMTAANLADTVQLQRTCDENESNKRVKYDEEFKEKPTEGEIDQVIKFSSLNIDTSSLRISLEKVSPISEPEDLITNSCDAGDINLNEAPNSEAPLDQTIKSQEDAGRDRKRKQENAFGYQREYLDEEVSSVQRQFRQVVIESLAFLKDAYTGAGSTSTGKKSDPPNLTEIQKYSTFLDDPPSLDLEANRNESWYSAANSSWATISECSSTSRDRLGDGPTAAGSSSFDATCSTSIIPEPTEGHSEATGLASDAQDPRKSPQASSGQQEPGSGKSPMPLKLPVWNLEEEGNRSPRKRNPDSGSPQVQPGSPGRRSRWDRADPTPCLAQRDPEELSEPEDYDDDTFFEDLLRKSESSSSSPLGVRSRRRATSERDLELPYDAGEVDALHFLSAVECECCGDKCARLVTEAIVRYRQKIEPHIRNLAP